MFILTLVVILFVPILLPVTIQFNLSCCCAFLVMCVIVVRSCKERDGTLFRFAPYRSSRPTGFITNWLWILIIDCDYAMRVFLG